MQTSLLINTIACYARIGTAVIHTIERWLNDKVGIKCWMESPAEVHQVDEGGEVLDLVRHEMGGGVGGLQHHGVDVVRALRDGGNGNIDIYNQLNTLVWNHTALAIEAPTVFFF